MAATWITPGAGPGITEKEDGAIFIIPGAGPGAKEKDAVGAVAPTSIFYGPLMGPLGGPK